MMVEITKQEWLANGEKLYGRDTESWEFRCIICNRVQSARSIREEQKKGIKSLRFGLMKKGDAFVPECDCYSPDCDYIANGLITTDILVIKDSAKPHDAALKENCCYVLPFAKGG